MEIIERRGFESKQEHLGGFPGGSDSKASTWNAGDPGSIPGSGRSPGEGSGNPLQYSCLENPKDRGAWWAAVHGVARSRTRLSAFHFQEHLRGREGWVPGNLRPGPGEIYSKFLGRLLLFSELYSFSPLPSLPSRRPSASDTLPLTNSLSALLQGPLR